MPSPPSSPRACCRPVARCSWPACSNFVGALSGTAVATTVGKGIIPPEVSTQALVISALIAAIIWNLVTWYFGVPSSSSHALIFSLVGAGVASAGWSAIEFGGLQKTFQGLVFSPMLGFAGGFPGDGGAAQPVRACLSGRR